MFNKIQPEQIQLHSFSSPSGTIKFEAGSNFVYANLSNSLTGSFNITGDLSVNNQRVQFPDPSNTVQSGNYNFILGGTLNTIQGTGNGLLNGIYNTINGKTNVVLNGEYSDFNINSEKNTLLAGNYASFQSGVTGAVILKDHAGYSTSDNGSNTLTVSFQSGVFFEDSPVNFISSDIYLGPTASGVFSGDCYFIGALKKNGLTVATTGDIYSNTTGLSSQIINTGANLNNLITGVSGSLVITGSGLSSRIDGLSGAAIFKTGDQTVSGRKSFDRDTEFAQSLYLKGNSGILSGIDASTAQIPIDSGDAVGERGLISYSGEYLFLKISDNPNQWIRFSGQGFW